jgi:hypothetical protein
MTLEWRATGGLSGLPVVDLGHLLRVPRRALEDLLGVELTPLDAPDVPSRHAESRLTPGDAEPSSEEAKPAPRRLNGRKQQPADQPGLFDPRAEGV